MSVVYFITHPEVAVDPSVPVPEWGLSQIGLERMRRTCTMPWLAGVRSISSSIERKAREAAGILGRHLALDPMVIHELHENDRSATGYLPRAEFEAVADAFFARPHESVRGWERAIDAQQRVVAAVEWVIAAAPNGDIAIVSHGAVGALLLCHLKGAPISRTEDQPGDGGGHVYSLDAATRRVVSGWRRIEEAP